jgi:hypothetical protein
VADAGGTLDATAAAFRARRHCATSAGDSAPRGGGGLRAKEEQWRLYGGTREPGTGRGSAGRHQDGRYSGGQAGRSKDVVDG